MSEPVFNAEKVVIDPGTGEFVPSIDATGGTFVESTKVKITGILADNPSPITLNLRRGTYGYVWEKITEIKPSSAVVYVQTS